jgi:hypothetical protein
MAGVGVAAPGCGWPASAVGVLETTVVGVSLPLVVMAWVPLLT